MRFARLGTVAAALLAVTAGCDTARTLESESELGSCNRCHGFPPAAPHPTVTAQETACNACHSETVAANGTIIAGGAHQNGVVDAAGGHAEGYASPAVHGPEGLAFLAGTEGALQCTSCHGTDFAGGTSRRSCNDCHAPVAGATTTWTQNCTFCHGNQQQNYAAVANPVEAAPPESVTGETAPTSHGVGAHQKHLRPGTYSNGFPCATCHVVPSDLGHVDRETEVTPSGPAGQAGAYDHATHSCSAYCHSPSTIPPAPRAASPSWVSATALGCTGCHASRPTTGRHTSTAPHADEPCATCHQGYVQDTTVDLAIHVDGAKTVRFTNRVGGTTTSTATSDATGAWICVVCHTRGDTGHPEATPFD